MKQNGQIVRASDLTKTYTVGAREIAALRGVSFTVSPGEFMVLLGPSGAGKTTTLILVGGLDRPSGGSLHVAGQLIATATATPVRAGSTRPPRPCRLRRLPPARRSPRSRTQVLIWRPTARDRAEALLCCVGLPPPTARTSPAVRCSALPRARAHQPAALLADDHSEP